jgi:hypothetical protein
MSVTLFDDNSIATALPMPDDAPVIQIVFPEKSIFYLLSAWHEDNRIFSRIK